MNTRRFVTAFLLLALLLIAPATSRAGDDVRPIFKNLARAMAESKRLNRPLLLVVHHECSEDCGGRYDVFVEDTRVKALRDLYVLVHVHSASMEPDSGADEAAEAERIAEEFPRLPGSGMAEGILAATPSGLSVGGLVLNAGYAPPDEASPMGFTHEDWNAEVDRVVRKLRETAPELVAFQARMDALGTRADVQALRELDEIYVALKGINQLIPVRRRIAARLPSQDAKHALWLALRMRNELTEEMHLLDELIEHYEGSEFQAWWRCRRADASTFAGRADGGGDYSNAGDWENVVFHTKAIPASTGDEAQSPIAEAARGSNACGGGAACGGCGAPAPADDGVDPYAQAYEDLEAIYAPVLEWAKTDAETAIVKFNLATAHAVLSVCMKCKERADELFAEVAEEWSSYELRLEAMYRRAVLNRNDEALFESQLALLEEQGTTRYKQLAIIERTKDGAWDYEQFPEYVEGLKQAIALDPESDRSKELAEELRTARRPDKPEVVEGASCG